MKVKNMVVKRIMDLCRERSITLNELANRSGLTPSTVYSITDEARKIYLSLPLKRFVTVLKLRLENFSARKSLIICRRRLNKVLIILFYLNYR